MQSSSNNAWLQQLVIIHQSSISWISILTDGYSAPAKAVLVHRDQVAVVDPRARALAARVLGLLLPAAQGLLVEVTPAPPPRAAPLSERLRPQVVRAEARAVLRVSKVNRVRYPLTFLPKCARVFPARAQEAEALRALEVEVEALRALGVEVGAHRELEAEAPPALGIYIFLLFPCSLYRLRVSRETRSRSTKYVLAFIHSFLDVPLRP